jgi:hypothetical protein
MKELKLPAAPLQIRSNLTDKDVMFFDMYIMFEQPPGDLYRLAYMSLESPVQLMKRAGAALASSAGKEYIQRRTIQLNEWFFDVPDETAAPKKKATTAEEAITSLTPRFIEELENIMKNRNDPNFSTMMEVYLKKVMKDIEMDRSATPPLRYLPETCANCRYKLFIDKECEDECKRCKYRKFGVESGLLYDHQTQLEDV